MKLTAAPPLDSGSVHVWRIRLDLATEKSADAYSALPETERSRADRLAGPALRTRFLETRRVLRSLIARYEGLPACDIAFEVDPTGKPALPGAPSLRFNIAHSGELALLAFARGAEVGIDVEGINDRSDVVGIAGRFFSETERKALLEVPSSRRRDAFFHAWVQKEAYVKGRGDGVARGLTQFDVAVDPDLPAALLGDAKDPLATRHWSLHTVDAGPGYRGALAVELARPRIRELSWG